MPIEDWAARAGRLSRRARRRLARRPHGLVGAILMVSCSCAVATNALWSQETRHPAPFFGAAVAEEQAVTVKPAAIAEQSDLVADVQAGLAALGYFEGTESGRLDGPTEAAIREFQADGGLEVTGEPGVGLLVAIGGAAPAEGAASGPEPDAAGPALLNQVNDVRGLQALLNARGYGPLEVDGVVGPMTRAALARLVADEGLADGTTRAVLDRVVAQGAS